MCTIDNLQYPPILYRYISWDNDHHKELLMENKAHFTSPEQFNDPFDCRVRILHRKAKEIRDYFKKRKDSWPPHIARLKPKERNKLIEMRVMEFSTKKGRRKSKEQFLRMIYDDYGILSLSERCDSLLMWAHYADCHKGLCVGIDTELLERSLGDILEQYQAGSELRPVRYSDEYPILDLFDLDRPLGSHIEYLAWKSSDWSYEKEWRMILVVRPEMPRKHKLRDGVIKQVILGCRVSASLEAEIRQAVQQRHPSATILRAQVCDDRFALEFVD